MTELYKNSITSNLQCAYAELISKLALRLTKAEPCIDMVLHSKAVYAMLKRIRYYNGLDSEIVDCKKLIVVRTDSEEIDITITVSFSENVSFNYVGENDATLIHQYFYSLFKNNFIDNNYNIDVELVNNELIFYIINEEEILDISYSISSVLENHNNEIIINTNCSNIECILLDSINCITYYNFCGMVNKVKLLLKKYNCKCNC